MAPKRDEKEVVEEVEESESDESSDSDSDSSSDSGSDSGSDSSSSSSDSDSSSNSDSSDDESSSSEEEREKKVKVNEKNGKANGNTKVAEKAKVAPQEKPKAEEDKKGKKKVVEEPKGTKHKRSDEESSRSTENQPDKKKAKTTTPSAPASSMPSSQVDTWRSTHNMTVVNTADGSTNTVAPYMNFSDAGFPDYIHKSIAAFKFATPTAIQAQTWPLAMQGKDTVGIAETGSGKTLAFGYPAIMHIKNTPNAPKGPKALVLAPTRELAQQIHEVLEKACAPASLTVCCVFGGMAKGPQIEAVKKSDIVIATPGRLIDLIQDGSAKLGNVYYVVFDEADRMLDMGFVPQIKEIVKHLPAAAKRQTLMYSATWPIDVQNFAHSYLRSPIQITIGSTNLSGAKKITQIVEVCSREQEKKSKLKALLKKLTASGNPKILVFMLYKHTCNSLFEELSAERWNVDCLHGNKSQSARNEAMANFRTGKTNILVATDVAARGLDIKDIKYVINVELPLVMEDYVHRIGRTGRAGEAGCAYTFFAPEDKQHARQLVRILEESSQNVPAELSKIAENAPVTRPRKSALEQLYGDFAKGADADFMKKKPTKITFD